MQDYQPVADCLQDRIVLITGAASDVGKVTALACASYGATVILLDQHAKKLEAIYDEIEAQGGLQPAIVPFNLATAPVERYHEIAANIQQEFGRLDGLVHAASRLGVLSPIEHFPPQEWGKVLQINLNAPFLLTQALMQVLKASKDASVVLNTSTLGAKNKAYWGAYGVATAALEGLTHILSSELTHNTSIRVNALNTGKIQSQLRAEAYPAEDPMQNLPLAAMIPYFIYLLGPDSQGVTDQLLTVAAAKEATT